MRYRFSTAVLLPFVLFVACSKNNFPRGACDVIPTLSAARTDFDAMIAVKAVIDWIKHSRVDQWDCQKDPLIVLVASADVIGVESILAALLSRGANPDVLNSDGHSALYVSAVARDVKNVDVLLAAHANPNLITNKGFTPLMGVVSIRAGTEESERNGLVVAKALINAGADPALRSKSGFTAAQIALSTKNIRLHELLVGHTGY